MNTLKLILKWTVLGLLAAVAIAYAGDYMSARYRMSKMKPGDPLEVSSVRKLYAIPQKNGKADYSFGDPETEVCIDSLFPHFGFDPCWYEHQQDHKPVVE